MLKDLALVLLLGLAAKHLATLLGFPGLIGMMLAGIILRQTNLVSTTFLSLSKDLRLMALIVILLRAGLGLDKKLLKKAGLNALLMSFIPCIFEGLTITLIAPYLLPISPIEAGLLGFILAAVSPAVVVPAMVKLQENGFVCDKGIPTLILAGASVDDVFAITTFSIILNIYLGNQINLAKSSLSLLSNLGLGVLIGLGIGYIIDKLFASSLKKLRSTEKLIILLGIAFLLTELAQIVPFASLLSIMIIGFIIQLKNPLRADNLTYKLDRIWVLASILLFFLVGAELPLITALKTGIWGVLTIAIGLIGRSLGVFLALSNSHLNPKEKLFCALAYIPKATVQAAMGALPLTYGVTNGDIILSVAVLSILLTAPLGAYLIEKSAPKLLNSKQTTSTLIETSSKKIN